MASDSTPVWCENCKYWELLDEDRGWCYRHAPVKADITTPMTTSEDGCGEGCFSADALEEFVNHLKMMTDEFVSRERAEGCLIVATTLSDAVHLYFAI